MVDFKKYWIGPVAPVLDPKMENQIRMHPQSNWDGELSEVVVNRDGGMIFYNRKGDKITMPAHTFREISVVGTQALYQAERLWDTDPRWNENL